MKNYYFPTRLLNDTLDKERRDKMRELADKDREKV
jgi:hypothetical protein